MLRSETFYRGRRLLLTAAFAVASWAIMPANAQAGVCGNGAVEVGEQCDDGNLVGGDACSAFCTEERCGNGTLDVGEACDPGTGSWSFPTPNWANANTASCTWQCAVSTCGDNFVNGTAGEDCDAGPTDSNGCNGASAPAGQKCKFASCRDGYLNTVHFEYGVFEQCDDGNVANDDACDNNCTPPACGNGIANIGEACDDGNAVNSDGCDNNCTVSACGNGVVAGVEQCDDGGNVAGDGCSAICNIETCGNTIVDVTEECDPPNSPWCDALCQYISCGDGDVQTTETCDPGTGITGNVLWAVASSLTCDANCTPKLCGDGFTNPVPGTGVEQCDPGVVGGNIISPTYGVACDAQCRLTQCGDGIVNSLEQCDPGPPAGPVTTEAWNSTAVCDPNCTTTTCGDSYVNTLAGEECDPPGLGLACDTSCQTIQCGNGTVEANEQCDTGCGFGGDPFMSNCAQFGCEANCTLMGCGNGFVSGTEACDDGNNVSGDGCDADCTLTACGNGIKTAGEECDGSPGCTNAPLCLDTICGNGVKAATEQCDDGNAVQGDGCTILCQTDLDRDGLLLGADPCNAINYSIPAAATPNQNPAKAQLKLSSLNQVAKHDIIFKGEFNPSRQKVCSGDPANLFVCTNDASCVAPGAPGGTCGPPKPNKTGVFIQVKNGNNVLYSLSVAGDLQAPGGEYIRLSPTPACGNRNDGWSVKSSASGKTTYAYVNKTGLLPLPVDLSPAVEGVCTGSARGLRSLTLIHDASKGKWTYNGTVSNTTLDLLPTVAGTGSSAAVQDKLQLELALGYDAVSAQGNVGQCFDNQFRGAGPGGTGAIPTGTCKVRLSGTGPLTVTCK